LFIHFKSAYPLTLRLSKGVSLETRQIDLFAKTADPAMQDTPLRIEVQTS